MEDSTKIVNILLSTYNGEKFLHEQLESLFAQKDIKPVITVRDDGSDDATIIFLNEYQKNNKLVWYTGENLGPARSFLDLLQQSEDYPYYAFCDQDDVWDEDKLKIAVDKLVGYTDIPAVYYSTAGKVDEELNPLPTSTFIQPKNFAGYLVTSGAGCTMVLNHTMAEVLKEYNPSYCCMHDLWVLRLCATLGGKIVYDTESHIKYRQHSSNVYGGQKSILTKIKYQIHNKACSSSNTAQELLKGYSDGISKEKLYYLEMLANYKKSFRTKMRLMFDKEVTTGRRKSDLVLRYLIITNKL